VYAVLSVLGFPLLSGYLFFKAFVTRKWDQIQKDQNKYDEYEEVVSEPVEDDEDFLELPELEIEKPTETNDYDDLFKD
jgi:hypothetical protein